VKFAEVTEVSDGDDDTSELLREEVEHVTSPLEVEVHDGSANEGEICDCGEVCVGLTNIYSAVEFFLWQLVKA
jgi:hypothetical protein